MLVHWETTTLAARSCVLKKLCLELFTVKGNEGRRLRVTEFRQRHNTELLFQRKGEALTFQFCRVQGRFQERQVTATLAKSQQLGQQYMGSAGSLRVCHHPGPSKLLGHFTEWIIRASSRLVAPTFTPF